VGSRCQLGCPTLAPKKCGGWAGCCGQTPPDGVVLNDYMGSPMSLGLTLKTPAAGLSIT